jgi:hypothetical protein
MYIPEVGVCDKKTGSLNYRWIRIVFVRFQNIDIFMHFEALIFRL